MLTYDWTKNGGQVTFSMALTGFLTIRMHLPKGGQIVTGGALAVFIVLYFASPAIPVVPKPRPLIDPEGHLLESPANESEMEVLRLQDAIVNTRQYMESEQYPESQKKLQQDDPYLAQRILAFGDDTLNPRRRYIKYEYAEYAYVNASAGAMYDDHAKAEEYASLAIKNADVALKMLSAAERTYQSDKDSQFLLDWVNEDQGKDRVLYFRAMAECMLATAKNDSSWRGKAGVTWNLINLSYRKQYPAEGTRQLDGCVALNKSN